MPPQAWNAKWERQYEDIKAPALERGSSQRRAEEIAARTVNKERAQTGEARSSSWLSKRDTPARPGAEANVPTRDRADVLVSSFTKTLARRTSRAGRK